MKYIDLTMPIDEKKVSIVGIDSFTPDNEPYHIHKIFLRNDILIVENVINLDKVAGQRFQCFILPMKITNADGSPCRIVAVLKESSKQETI